MQRNSPLSKITTASLSLGLVLSLQCGAALANNSNQANDLIRQGQDEAKHAKHFDAINHYSKAIELNPVNHYAYFYRARSRKALADWQKAIEDLNYVIKLNPKSAMAYTERGWCLRKLDLPKRALADFDMALKLSPDNVKALEYRASLKYKLGDMQGALADLNQVLKLKPNSSKQLADLLLPKLNLVKKTSSNDKSGKRTESISLGENNSIDFKVDTTDEGRSTTDKNELAVINNEAAKAIKKGKFDQAVKILQPITEEHPDYDFARRNLTIAYNNYGLQLARSNTKQAADKFRWALYYSPSEATSRRNLNAIIQEQGHDPRSYDERIEFGNDKLRENNPRLAFVEFTEALRLRNTPNIRRKLAEVCLLLENKPNTDPVEIASAQSGKLEAVSQFQKTAHDTSEQSIANTPDQNNATTDSINEDSTKKISSSANIGQDETVNQDNKQDQKEQEEQKEQLLANQGTNTIASRGGGGNLNSGQAPTSTVVTTPDSNQNKQILKMTALSLPAPANSTGENYLPNSKLKSLAAQVNLSQADLLRDWTNHMNSGQEQFDQGDYISAERSFETASTSAQKLGADSRELALSLEKLAEVYLIHRQVSQAYSLLARALVILSRHHSVDDPILVKLRDKMESISTSIDGGKSNGSSNKKTSLAASD